MSDSIRKLAEDLEKLSAGRPKPVIKPSEEQTANYAAIVRSVFDYAVQQAPDDSTAQDVGEAVAIGLRVAADEMSVRKDRLYESFKAFLESVVTAVHNDLVE